MYILVSQKYGLEALFFFFFNTFYLFAFFPPPHVITMYLKSRTMSFKSAMAHTSQTSSSQHVASSGLGKIDDIATRIIQVWSCPRSLSTALMYSFAQRSDTKVVCFSNLKYHK